MKVGSLFSGIGGFELGFERAGFDVAFQVEIDPWCRRVLAKHWPTVPKYEDVRHVGSHNLEWVDVLIGGFPCQDISAAGKGAGIDGARSGLWSEYRRLIDELRPRYAVMENVGALLYRGLGRVLGDLAEIGYDAEWQVLPASAFGAPHRRDRIFIVAYPSRKSGYGIQAHKRPEVFRPRLWSLQPRGRVDAPATGAGGEPEWAIHESGLGGVANAFSFRVERLRAYGNSIVPTVAQYVAECVKAHAQATGVWVEAA